MHEQEDQEQGVREQGVGEQESEPTGFWKRHPWMVAVCVIGGWILFRVINSIQMSYTGVNVNPLHYLGNWVREVFT